MHYRYGIVLLAFASLSAAAGKGAQYQPPATPPSNGGKGAQYQPPPKPPRLVLPYLTLTFGWDWAQVGKSQHVLLVDTDPAPDFFDTTETTSSKPLFGASVGVEFPLFFANTRWASGAGYYITTPFETQGIEYFYSLPDFGNIEYSYNVMSQRVMFENKVLYEFEQTLIGFQKVFIYGIVGLGAAFNKAYDYDEVALDPQTPTDKGFKSNTMTSFAYSVGAGIEAAFAYNMRVGVGYRFTDLGEVSLGSFDTGNTSETINVNNVYVQEALLQLTVLF